MKKIIIAAGVFILIGFAVVAYYDFGGRERREEERANTAKAEMNALIEKTLLKENADVNNIRDFCKTDIKIKNLTYFKAVTVDKDREDEFVTVKVNKTEENENGILVSGIDSRDFEELLSSEFMIDFNSNSIYPKGEEKYIILKTPVKIENSWLSELKMDSLILNYNAVIKNIDLKRSILLNHQSFILEGIIEIVFENDTVFEGAHTNTRYNFKWSPQINSFVEITMKTLYEADKLKSSSTVSMILKEADIEK